MMRGDMSEIIAPTGPGVKPLPLWARNFSDSS